MVIKPHFFKLLAGVLLLIFVVTYLTLTQKSETSEASIQFDTPAAPESAQLSAEARHQAQQVHYRQITEEGYGQLPAIDVQQHNPQLDSVLDAVATPTAHPTRLSAAKRPAAFNYPDYLQDKTRNIRVTEISGSGLYFRLSKSPDCGLIYRPDPHVLTLTSFFHQIRNSMKQVASKNQKAFMAGLKPVYRASSKDAAETALDELEAKWGTTYPIVLKSWRRKWTHLSAYFKYPEPIRKIIYTTNAVEAIHRQFRKLTKTKGAFPNENSLLKLLYAGILNATEKWTMPIQDWSQAPSQLDIYFEDRLDSVLDI